MLYNRAALKFLAISDTTRSIDVNPPQINSQSAPTHVSDSQNTPVGTQLIAMKGTKPAGVLSTARLWVRAMHDSDLNVVAEIFTFLQLGVELAQYSEP